MKYWAIVYLGGEGEDCFETLSEEEILDYYFPRWCKMMTEANRSIPSNAKQMCIDDWVWDHCAIESHEGAAEKEKI